LADALDPMPVRESAVEAMDSCVSEKLKGINDIRLSSAVITDEYRNVAEGYVCCLYTLKMAY
jgi:hypothetical protein